MTAHHTIITLPDWESTLPFIRQNDDGIHHYWHVHATGDDYIDEVIGRHYGKHFVEFMQECGSSEMLKLIAQDMGLTLTTMQQGFFMRMAEGVWHQKDAGRTDVRPTGENGR